MNTTHIRKSFRLIAAAALLLAIASVPAFAADAGKVNINSASVDELQLLPRIGPSVAARIVEHREKNGQFKTAEDLMLVRGIGEATFELLKPYVSVTGGTTLTEKVPSPRKAKADDSAAKG
jgi:competence protein ComEA